MTTEPKRLLFIEDNEADLDLVGLQWREDNVPMKSRTCWELWSVASLIPRSKPYRPILDSLLF